MDVYGSVSQLHTSFSESTSQCSTYKIHWKSKRTVHTYERTFFLVGDFFFLYFGVDDNSISVLCVRQSFADDAHDNFHFQHWSSHTFSNECALMLHKSVLCTSVRMFYVLNFMFTSHGLHFFFVCLLAGAQCMNSMSILCIIFPAIQNVIHGIIFVHRI